MNVTYVEGFSPEAFDRWFSLFDYLPILATLAIILILRNVLLGFDVSIKWRGIEFLVDVGCLAFVFLVRECIRINGFQGVIVFIEFALIYTAYYFKRKTYPGMSTGRPIVLALWDVAILLIALACWSVVRTMLLCTCI